MSSVSGPAPASMFYKWYIACGIGILLSTFFFAARIVSRWLQNHKFDASDAILFAALLAFYGNCGVALAGTNGQAGGSNFTDPSTSTQSAYLRKILLANQVLDHTCLACVKMSFLFLFRVLFPGRGIRIFIDVVGFSVILWWLVIVLLAIPQYKMVPMNIPGYYISAMITNVATDLIILTIPQFFVWKLHVSLRTKLGLAFIFLLGGCVTIFSVIRFSYVLQINDEYFLWSAIPYGTWTITELSAAIVSASLPMLRPLALRISQEVKTTFGNKTRISQPIQGFQGHKLEAHRKSYPLAGMNDRQNILLAESTAWIESDSHAILATTTFGVSTEPKAEGKSRERVGSAEKPMTWL